MVKGLFSKATATNGSEVKHVSPGGSNVSFTGLYSGATYMVLLEYEHNYRQCDHILTICKFKIDLLHQLNVCLHLFSGQMRTFTDSLHLLFPPR